MYETVNFGRQDEVACSEEAKSFPRSGVNGETIGVIGLGKIGTRLTEHLQQFGFHVLAYDPFLTPERASELGVEQVSLKEH